MAGENGFREWMLDKFDADELRDMARYGVAGGFSGLIYTSDITALYDRYEHDIWDILSEVADGLGQSVLSLLDNVDGGKTISPEQYKTTAVWVAAETVAHDAESDRQVMTLDTSRA